jgi:DinB superfamily
MAGPITPAEREQLIKHLEMSREAFLMGVNGLSTEQLNYRPSPESWTVLECAEHITVAEDNMFNEFQEKFMSLEPQAAVTSATTDDQVLEYGYNRELQKAKAPESYKPTGRWDALDGIIMQFLTSREKTLTLARKMNEDLRGRYLADFKLDGYQYLLILSAHCQRHAKQIKEIRESAEFPQ